MPIDALAIKGILKTVTVDFSDYFGGEEASITLREPTYLQFLDLQHEQLALSDARDAQIPLENNGTELVTQKKAALEAATAQLKKARSSYEATSSSEAAAAMADAQAAVDTAMTDYGQATKALEAAQPELLKNEKSQAVLKWFTANLSNLIMNHSFSVKSNVELAALITENKVLLIHAASSYFPFLAARAGETK